jgi:glycosyltransferase involved in cell wall biosynthesis
MVSVAIPRLGDYRRAHGGISRVVAELSRHWPECQLSEAAVITPKLPIIRNMRGRLDVADDADVLLLPQLTGAHLLKNLRVPSVVIVHDVGIVDCPEDRRDMNWLTRASVRRSLHSLRYATRIVAVSHFTARRLAIFVPEIAEKIIVIPSGVAEVFRTTMGIARQKARQHLGFLIGRDIDGPVLLYVGTERSRKNVPLLLEALKALKRHMPAVRLAKVGAAGGGRHRAATLRRMAELGLTPDDVVFVPALEDRDLALAYRAADVYVSASLYEGFCLPVAEALVVGTPVVAVAAGAVGEVVGPLGMLVPPNAQQFADAVQRALSGPGMDQAEHARFVARYTWPHAAHQYAEVMRQLLR